MVMVMMVVMMMKCGDRHVVNRCALQVEVNGLKVFDGRLCGDLHVIGERVAGLRPEKFRALYHLTCSNRVRS